LKILEKDPKEDLETEWRVEIAFLGV